MPRRRNNHKHHNLNDLDAILNSLCVDNKPTTHRNHHTKYSTQNLQSPTSTTPPTILPNKPERKSTRKKPLLNKTKKPPRQNRKITKPSNTNNKRKHPQQTRLTDTHIHAAPQPDLLEGIDHAVLLAASKNKSQKDSASDTNDELENVRLVEHVRLLTEKKLNNERRKEEIAKQKTKKQINKLTAKFKSDAHAIANNASKRISNAVDAFQKSLKQDMNQAAVKVEQLAATNKSCHDSVMQEGKAFENTVKKLASQLHTKRVVNHKKAMTRERKIVENAARISTKRQKFSRVLNHIIAKLDTHKTNR